MNVFKKIKEIFERRKALNEIYDDLNNLDEVFLEKKLEIFNELITPRFAEIGLKNWNGKYLWFSDFNEEGIKHVVEFNVFKYFGGCFSYGNCYDFIPTFSNKNKISYHRTDKSTKILYDKKFKGWQKSYEDNSPINIDKISTVNEDKLRKSIQLVLDNNVSYIENWFVNNKSIDENISSLLIELENSTDEIGFAQPVISTDYLLGFLYEKKEKHDLSKFHILKHFEKKRYKEDNEIQLKILKDRFDFL